MLGVSPFIKDPDLSVTGGKLEVVMLPCNGNHGNGDGGDGGGGKMVVVVVEDLLQSSAKMSVLLRKRMMLASKNTLLFAIMLNNWTFGWRSY